VPHSWRRHWRRHSQDFRCGFTQKISAVSFRGLTYWRNGIQEDQKFSQKIYELFRLKPSGNVCTMQRNVKPQTEQVCLVLILVLEGAPARPASLLATPVSMAFTGRIQSLGRWGERRQMILTLSYCKSPDRDGPGAPKSCPDPGSALKTWRRRERIMRLPGGSVA